MTSNKKVTGYFHIVITVAGRINVYSKLRELVWSETNISSHFITCETVNNWEDKKSEKYTSSEMKTANSQLFVRRKILNGQSWHQQLSTLF